MSYKNIFPTDVPILTQTHWGIPEDVVLLNPASDLDSREWLYLLYHYTVAGKGVTDQDLVEFKKRGSTAFGSRTTLWRVKKSLKEKGYL